MLTDKKRHPRRIDSTNLRANLCLMFFFLRCLFWLGLVFVALPLSGIDLRPDLSGAQQAVSEVATDRVKDWCLKDPATCAKGAAEAADLLGLIPSKGLSQNTLQPTDLKPAWRGHGEGARPTRG